MIGRQFPLSLATQVVQRLEDELHRLLSSLQAKEFLYEQPAFPEVEYFFKHALSREVAYDTVLQEQRKAWHERTGQAMEVLYHENLDEHYSELAHHYHQSKNAEKAIEYLHLAGQQAVQWSANSEAAQLLATALEVLQTWPDTPERLQQELELLLTLGPVLIADKGWATPEVKTTYFRARDLCQQAGNAVQLHSALWGLWTVYLTQAEHQITYESAQQLLHHAQSGQDSASLLAAFRALGESEVWRGEFSSAHTHLEESIALYDPQQHQELAFRYGEALEVTNRCVLAWCLWYLGYPDQAVKQSTEAFALAREGSHTFSVIYVQVMTAFVHQYRREAPLAEEWAEAGLTLSNEQGSDSWMPWLTIVSGSVVVEKGRLADGISQLREGLTAWRASGTAGWQSYFLVLLAEAYRAGGQVEEGLSMVAEAEAFVEKTGERWCEAELYRLKGELTLQLGTRGWRLEPRPPSSQAPSLKPQIPSGVVRRAEECFLKAIAVAQKQQAKSLELRAATSLARLWQSQGKTTAARNLLAPVYNWFTEGFDTADLKDAKALLEALAQRGNPCL